MVFGAIQKKTSFDMKVLENSDIGAHDAFVRKVPIGRFADQSARRKFHMKGIDGILFVDTSANDYESDLCFWNGSSYDHEPVDY